jgi:hypothetical protein
MLIPGTGRDGDKWNKIIICSVHKQIYMLLGAKIIKVLSIVVIDLNLCTVTIGGA